MESEKPVAQPKCPGCNRPFQIGREKCPWCGGDLRGVALPVIEYFCPRCEGTALVERHQGEWAAEVCPGCGGSFLSSVMMAKLEEFYANARPAAGGAARLPETAPGGENFEPLYRKCPMCRAQMARRRYHRISNVIVDECLGHGYWLDQTELEQIVAFLGSGGARKSEAFDRADRERQARAAKDIQAIWNKARNSYWHFTV